MNEKAKMAIAQKIKAALDSYKAGTGGFPPVYRSLLCGQVTAIDLEAKTMVFDCEDDKPRSFSSLQFENFLSLTPMAEAPANEEIAIIWCIDDVTTAAKDLGVKLTRKQKVEVLKFVEKHHDSTVGVNWDVINSAIDTILQQSITH